MKVGLSPTLIEQVVGQLGTVVVVVVVDVVVVDVVVVDVVVVDVLVVDVLVVVLGGNVVDVVDVVVVDVDVVVDVVDRFLPYALPLPFPGAPKDVVPVVSTAASAATTVRATTSTLRPIPFATPSVMASSLPTIGR